jgi:hypothetical protein
MSLPALIEVLCRPEAYPHHPQTVELVQTHISYVFLAGDAVYKVKKPVRFSFLDFSTLSRRRHFCHEEVRLNHRLAGDVYQGVVAICDDGDGVRLSNADDPAAIEYAVHMRRLPHDRTLDQLLVHNAVSAAMIDTLAARLTAFHAAAATNDEIRANGTTEAVWKVLTDNYNNVQRFRGITIDAPDDDAIRNFACAFLDDNEALFRRRQAQGRIRDCHGDLHTDHIYFTEPLVIVDCIEFNTQFRFIDVASDLAFLAMDLDYHGRPELTQRLVERYVALSNDTDIPRLLPFYQCYRAYVRGKVDSLKSVEPELGKAEQDEAAESARRHFALAYRYTWKSAPALVVVAGLSGTGKSAVASALSERTGFAHINSDVVRKQLAGLALTARAGTTTGLYSETHSARTYDAMLATAATHLAAKRGVIIDATFQLRRGRDAARALAAAQQVPLLLVECHCPEDVVRRRLAERAARGDSPSDADWNIYLEQRKRYEAIGDDEAAGHLVLDTAAAPEHMARLIEQALRQRSATL